MLANLDSENILRILLRSYGQLGLRGLMHHINGPSPNDSFSRLIENITKNIC